LKKIQLDIDKISDLISLLGNLMPSLEIKINQMTSISFSEMDQSIFAKVDETKKSYEASQKIVNEKYAKIDSYLNTIDNFQKELGQHETSLKSLVEEKKPEVETVIANLQQKISDYFSLVNTLKIEAATLSSVVETSKINYDNSIIELDQIIKISDDKMHKFESKFIDAIEMLNQITIERGKQAQFIQYKENEFGNIQDRLNESRLKQSKLIANDYKKEDLIQLDENLKQVKILSERMLESYLHIIKQLEEVNDRIDLNSNRLIDIEKQKKSKQALIYEFLQMKEYGK
jgi:hypothetical protein